MCNGHSPFSVGRQSLNLLTVAAVASQTITALQALGSIRKLAVEWIYPVRRIIELTKLPGLAKPCYFCKEILCNSNVKMQR